jgi:hypothetical protein
VLISYEGPRRGLPPMSPCSVAHHPFRAKGLDLPDQPTGLPEWEMARARQLLDTTKLHVAEIGREVGYADPFNFPASSAACTA